MWVHDNEVVNLSQIQRNVQREETVGETCILCNNSVTNQQHLQRENEELKLKNEEKGKLIEELRKENLKLNTIVQSTSKIFNEDQLKRLQNPDSRSKWSDKTIQDSIGLYYLCGTTAYSTLQKGFNGKSGWPIPHPRTLQRHLAEIQIEPGICEDVFTMLKIKVNLMEEKDKNCGLIIDEMAIQPKYEFNSTTQSFMGRPTLPATEAVYKKRAFDPYWKREHDLAHHGFNIIAVGMGLRWKSFVSYHLTDTSFDPDITAQWIIQVIRRLTDIGLKIRFQTFDSSTMNVAL